MKERNAMASRSHAKQIYGPLQDKTLRSVLIKKLIEEYGYSDKIRIAETLVDDFMDLIEAYSPSKDKVKPGQMVWMATAIDEKHGYGKKMKDIQQLPVILTTVSDEDLKKYASGERLRDIAKHRVVRMTIEAKKQGGTLAQSELAVITNQPQSQVSIELREWQEENDTQLPTRGVVHDAGKSTTHKGKIIKLHLKGYSTLDIARMTDHDPTSVDRYLRDFEIVKILADNRETPEQISYITRMSPSLVNEYLEIIRKNDKGG